MRISDRRLKAFIGGRVVSTSPKSWISGTDPAIATSKSEDVTVAALRPHFENDVVLTRVVGHLEAEIIIRAHFED